MSLGKTERERQREKEMRDERSISVTRLSACFIRIEIKPQIQSDRPKNQKQGQCSGIGVGAAGTVTVAAGCLGGWCMVTVVHGIRGTVSNLLFRLYVGQEWLSPATLSTAGAAEREGEEVDWCYIR